MLLFRPRPLLCDCFKASRPVGSKHLPLLTPACPDTLLFARASLVPSASLVRQAVRVVAGAMRVCALVYVCETPRPHIDESCAPLNIALILTVRVRLSLSLCACVLCVCVRACVRACRDTMHDPAVRSYHVSHNIRFPKPRSSTPSSDQTSCPRPCALPNSVPAPTRQGTHHMFPTLFQLRNLTSASFCSPQPLRTSTPSLHILAFLAVS